MNKAVISNRIYMRNYPDLEEKIVNELTYKIPPKFQGGFPTIVRTWLKVNDKIIAVPKARTDLIPEDYEIVNKTVLPDINKFDINYTLRPDQQDVVDLLDGNGIINAKPGWGKTFTAASLINNYQTKTLILTHTKILANQWLEHFNEHTSIIPGFIGSSKFDCDSDVVIALVQTINKDASKVANKFGLVIVDECHHCPASTFTKTLHSLKNTYSVGLSATLQRTDGKHVILPDFFGTNVLTPLDDNRMEPLVRVIDSPVAIPGSSHTPWATRINELYLNEEYRQFISFIVKTKQKEGHKVLCLADRTDFLDWLHRQDEENSVVIHSKISENRDDLLQLLREGKKNTIYGGSKIFSEGVSENYLSCIVLAFPLSNTMGVEQAVSRVLRKHPNKLQPEIIDIRFPRGIGSRQFNTRKRVYINEGWKIMMP